MKSSKRLKRKWTNTKRTHTNTPANKHTKTFEAFERKTFSEKPVFNFRSHTHAHSEYMSFLPIDNAFRQIVHITSIFQSNALISCSLHKVSYAPYIQCTLPSKPAPPSSNHLSTNIHMCTAFPSHLVEISIFHNKQTNIIVCRVMLGSTD